MNIVGEWYAFYSEQQKNILINNYKLNINFNKPKNSLKTITNYYQLKNSTKVVEVTEVISTNDYACLEKCPIRFSDTKYLGIVTKWIAPCKRLSN